MISFADYLTYKKYMIPIKQWAEQHHKSVGAATRMIKDDRIKKVFKSEGHWFIDITESWPSPKKALPCEEKRIRRIFSMLESDHHKLLVLAHMHDWSTGMEIAHLINADFKRLNAKD